MFPIAENIAKVKEKILQNDDLFSWLYPQFCYSIRMKDYELANQKAKELFETLNLTVSISVPLGDVQGDWPQILFHLIFSGRQNSPLSLEYRLGVGHVDWKIKTPSSFVHHLSADQENVVYAVQRNSSVSFKNKQLHASTAAQLAKNQKVTPKSYEVLASYCRDALAAHDESFENWAANFDYDADSIKAKNIYDHCGGLYHKLAALIGADNVQKFNDLANEFWTVSVTSWLPRVYAPEPVTCWYSMTYNIAAYNPRALSSK